MRLVHTRQPAQARRGARQKPLLASAKAAEPRARRRPLCNMLDTYDRLELRPLPFKLTSGVQGPRFSPCASRSSSLKLDDRFAWVRGRPERPPSADLRPVISETCLSAGRERSRLCFV